jgi:hypothetical protein
MSDSGIIIVAAARMLAALQQRFTGAGAVHSFAESDAVAALQAILADRPSLIVLERVFATTPRGTALITRIKSDQSLDEAEIRVVSHDGSYSRVARRGRGGQAPEGAKPAALAPSPKLDPTGTRRAPRYGMRAGLDAKVDGSSVTLVDLATLGAQVLSPTVLRPNQRVQITVADQVATIACRAMIAWASFERPAKGADPCYRAGLEFLAADADALEAFCRRNGV